MGEFKDRLDEAMTLRNTTAAELSRLADVNEGAISQYRAGKYKASQRSLDKLARALRVSIPWLMGADVPMEDSSTCDLPSPTTTDDVATFYIQTSVAAHYDAVSDNETLEGEKVEIPTSYLHGRNPDEFCAMRVKGNSMYPQFQDGDIVIVLKQETLDHSGQIGVICYAGDEMTIKRINFVDGEDWLELIPLNNAFPPKRIEGADLELCKVIGLPRIVIRELN